MSLSFRGELSERVIGSAMMFIGISPGLLEAVYEECLVFRVETGGQSEYRVRWPLPFSTREFSSNACYRMDSVVEISTCLSKSNRSNVFCRTLRPRDGGTRC